MLILKLSDYTKKSAIDHICGVEGGDKFTDIKQDKGGKTRYGITEATAIEFKYLWAKHNFNGDMSTLPYALAFEIYDLGWWQRLRLDDVVAVHPLIADRLLDMGVNGGRSVGVTFLQRILNVFNNQGKLYPDLAADGGIGNKTIDALRACVNTRGQDAVLNIVINMLSLQNAFYVTLAEKDPTQETFSFGWANRVKDANLNVCRFFYNK